MEPSNSHGSNSKPTSCRAEQDQEMTRGDSRGETGVDVQVPSAHPTPELKPVPVQRKAAWSVPSTTEDGTVATKGSKTLSFADIVAEQCQDRTAAFAAYGTDRGTDGGPKSLAQIEAEQERWFSTLQGQTSRGSDPDPTVAPSKADVPPSYPQDAAFHDDDLDAEELRLIQMAMRQSLDDFHLNSPSGNRINSNSNSRNGDEDAKLAPNEREGIHPSSIVDERQHDVSTMSNLPTEQDLTNHSKKSQVPDGAASRRKICNSSNSSAPILSKSLNEEHFSERTLREIERTEAVVDNPHMDARRMEQRRRLSLLSHSRISPSPGSPRRSVSLQWDNRGHSGSGSSTARSESAAAARAPSLLNQEHYLSPMELLQIEIAIRETERSESEHDDVPGSPDMLSTKMPTSQSQQSVKSSNDTKIAAVATGASPAHPLLGLSEDEAAAIEAALREADAKEEAESVQLALQIQEEELRQAQELQEKHRRLQQTSGNVRTMTRAELQAESAGLHGHPGFRGYSSAFTVTPWIGAVATTDQARRHPLDDSVDGVEYSHSGRLYDADENDRHHKYLADEEEAGFRMNSATHQQWNRLDRNTIVGPNHEVRTKHDVKVQGQTNAQLLDLDANDHGVRAHVGNQALNSFRKTMKRTTKGVASHGTGRAGSDTDATRGKALDPHVRLQISRAINNGLIERCNGAVKQGKEAIVYHAKGGGAGSQGFDVAVKVFKRIQEFRGRGEYVDGDPRYAGRAFRCLTDREQLELWTEKEYRNLVRAHRAKVPVPTPLHFKDNIIFMRFMGNSGWPSPQIREIDMRKESRKWDALYTQVMESIRRLYVDARLVHGDLSEYNILISPTFQVDHPISSVEDPSNDLQTVLIDFGQAVDVRHPRSRDLLERDLARVKDFFTKQGAKTLSADEALEYVADGTENGRDEESVPSISSSQRSIVNA